MTEYPTNNLSNIELEHFRENVRKWVDFDNQIKASQKQIKNIKILKDELNKTILDFMKNHGIGDIQIADGSLKLCTSKRLNGIKKEYILTQLKETLGNPIKAEECTSNIFENRQVIEIETLKRTI